MLALIADKHNALDAAVAGKLEDFIDRPSGQQARFIDDPEFVAGLGRQGSGEQFGHGLAFDAGVIQRLDTARGGAESSHRPALGLGELFDAANHGGLGELCSVHAGQVAERERAKGREIVNRSGQERLRHTHRCTLPLVRNGYNVKNLCELLNSKPGQRLYPRSTATGTHAAAQQPAARRRGAALNRSRLIWVLADVVGLFSIKVGSFSPNVGQKQRIFSANLGRKLRRYRAKPFMLSGRYS